jgi:hypothetical protein
MKRLLTLLAATALLVTVSSCTKCYVCVDKEGDHRVKAEVCDKDYDRDEIHDIIDDIEDNSDAECRPSSAII